MTIQQLMETTNVADSCKAIWNTPMNELTTTQAAQVDLVLAMLNSDPSILRTLPSEYKPRTVGWHLSYCKSGNDVEILSHPDCIVNHGRLPQHPTWELTLSGALIHRSPGHVLDGRGVIFVRGGKKLELREEQIGQLNLAGVKTVRVISESQSGIGVDKGEIQVESIPIQRDNSHINYLLVFLVIVLVSIVAGIAAVLWL